MKHFSRQIQVAVFIGSLLPALSQDTVPEASSEAGTGTAGTGTTKEVPAKDPAPGASKDSLGYLYNEKPKDGTAASKADAVSEMINDKVMALDAISSVSSLVSPAFEAYLSTEEYPADLIQAYEDAYDQSVDFIRKRDISSALGLLIDMSGYNWDTGASEQLANRVIAVWDMRRNQKDLTALNEKLRDKAKSAARNFDLESDAVMKKMRDNDRRTRTRGSDGEKGGDATNKAFLPAGGGGVPSATNAVDALIGKMNLTEEYLRGLESRAKVVLNEAEMKEAEKKAREDFSAYIKVLHDGRWLHQTKLAADFYRVLFGDGDLPVGVAEMSVKSGETLQRIRNDVKVFAYKAGKDEIASATSLLAEDFQVAPNHPALRVIHREDKLRVANYISNLQKLQNLIEARDFTNLDELLIIMESEVKDFDPIKPKAIVRAVKRESQMRLGMAKLYAQQGKLEDALSEFKTAAEAWPDNPDLDAASEKFFTSQDVQNKSTVEFDRAAKDRNYRRIFENSLEFGVAVKGDQVREDQMKDALEKVRAAETALEKAKLFEQGGDVYGSWETVELAAKEWPEDSELNRRRAELSMQASVFVSKLSKASKEEMKGHDGVALAYFLNAREDYPMSKMANEGIKRIGDKILGRDPEIPEPVGSSSR